MTKTVVVVENPNDVPWLGREDLVVTARDFLLKRERRAERNIRVVNLCRNFDYLSLGYYCSLLAEARQQRVIPSVATILELRRKTLYGLVLDELDDLLAGATKDMSSAEVGSFTFHVYFGRTESERFRPLARKLFDTFRAPLLKIEVRRRGDRWTLGAIRMPAVADLSIAEQESFRSGFEAYTKLHWRAPRPRPSSRYDIAILHDPNEKLPPSNARALQKFVKVGESMGIDVELVERKDYLRIAEYDALFIRETTALDHHTYRFAKKAAFESMPVIDDPDSILKCTNKVFLAELLKANNVPTPKTMIVDRSTLATIETEFSFPVILKIPDGSFSRGVVKVEDRAGLRAGAADLMRKSELIIAQEFMYTDFDWRVGVLNRKPIFVSQYFMSKGHWQIIQHTAGGAVEEGDSKTLLIDEAPAAVMDTAVKAAGLIGDGLYGVDLKQNERGVFVMEVNDNPNIDAGYEDSRLKDDLYRIILEDFVRRLEEPGRRWRAAPMAESPSAQ